MYNPPPTSDSQMEILNHLAEKPFSYHTHAGSGAAEMFNFGNKIKVKSDDFFYLEKQKLIQKIKTCLFGPELKVGQVWRFGDRKNPFEGDYADQIILEIKNGYVRYLVKTESGIEWEDSDTKWYFKLGSYLIKDVDGGEKFKYHLESL